MSLTLLPSRSRSLVPSLAPSWCGPCRTLRLVWMMTSCSALSGLSAFIWTVSLLLSPLRRRLFVSPSRPSRPLFKNAISFFLRDVISSAGASRPEVSRLRAHDIRNVSTLVAFHHNWSVSTVLESATWASSSVFTSFYLHDLQHEFDGILSLGPFVAAGSRIG